MYTSVDTGDVGTRTRSATHRGKYEETRGGSRICLGDQDDVPRRMVTRETDRMCSGYVSVSVIRKWENGKSSEESLWTDYSNQCQLE